MSLRLFFILAATMLAFAFAAPVEAAPVTQTDDEPTVEELLVTSTTAFTLTVRIDEVTTVDIPVQVDWRAIGPVAGSEDELLVTIAPSVLRTGFFSVTVGSIEAGSGTLAYTLTQPVEETAPVTTTTATTGTAPTTGTTPVTGTTTSTTTVTPPPSASTTDGPTANAVSNLRAGPSTDYAIVGSASAGDALDIVGQSSDGTWFVLANGAWIAAFLVTNAPTGLPVVEAPPLAAPAATPTPATTDILVPTATPVP